MIGTHRLNLATEQISRGEFQPAIDTLGELWPGLGVEPLCIDGDYPQLLLICGILTQELGEMRLARSQSSAKDMLSKAARLFGSDPREQEARFWLGIAYLRCGEHREALAIANDLLEGKTGNAELVFCAGRLQALARLNLGETGAAETALYAIEVFLPVVSALARGRFYLNRGMVHRQSGRYELALNDYAEATVAFRDAGSLRYEAAAENNRAGVLMEQGRLEQAEEAARSAVLLFRELGDRAHEAKALDQLAQVFGRAERFEEMEIYSNEAVAILSSGDHDGWLAEALTTHGIACGRLGLARAQEHLQHALEICDRQGDPKQADVITRAMWQAAVAGKNAVDLLSISVAPLERAACERVLEKHSGRIRPAAQDLGLTHQSFQRKLENHFPDLLAQRRPKRRRHKSLISR